MVRIIHTLAANEAAAAAYAMKRPDDASWLLLP